MARRYVSIWFSHLLADWTIRRTPELLDVPFVIAAPERGKMMVKAVNTTASAMGISANMVVADCRAIFPALQVLEYKPEQSATLLTALAEWCIRYTPVVAVDEPDGLLLDVSGCAHLWGSEHKYLADIVGRLRGFGYHVQAAMADTAGAAWAMARYSHNGGIIAPGLQLDALLALPPSALRISPVIAARLHKLGLTQIRSFISMPRRALRRRFSDELLLRLDQALGQEIEVLHPVNPIVPYQERLPSLEPIRTAKGIEIALQQLLHTLCARLRKEGAGLRKCKLICYRVDGNIQHIEIGTVMASCNVNHLFKLFENKIASLQPGLGFELFIIEAAVVEDIAAVQDTIWQESGHNTAGLYELLDRIAGRAGLSAISRYAPAEHYWPERSFTRTTTFAEKMQAVWRTDLPRPLHLLHKPEPIEVTVPVPDYPPMLFIYRGKIHNVKKADGPERIEQEWWIATGLYRDYYCVEDEYGARYWLFRLGQYDSGHPQWFVHGFFA